VILSFLKAGEGFFVKGERKMEYIAIVMPNNEGAIKKFSSEEEARSFLDKASDMLYVKVLVKGEELK